jgi:hypothetical protein
VDERQQLDVPVAESHGPSPSVAVRREPLLGAGRSSDERGARVERLLPAGDQGRRPGAEQLLMQCGPARLRDGESNELAG